MTLAAGDRNVGDLTYSILFRDNKALPLPLFRVGATTFPAPKVTTPTMISPSSSSLGSRFRSLPIFQGHFQDEGVHEETDDELVDSEIAAAMAAHDCPGVGM